MVCADSNQANDNTARKLPGGIPEVKGGRFVPNILGVARHWYDYKDLRDISIRDKALQFDHKCFGKDCSEEGQRTKPSLRAKKKVGSDFITFLYTLSTSGNTQLRELKPPFDVAIVDESSHSVESEILVSLGDTARQYSGHRLHVLLVGD